MMTLKTLHVSGDAGKHIDADNNECPGRAFDVDSSGVGGVYIREVTCTACGIQLLATGDRVWSPKSA
jgi:hypothetical protein